MSKLAALLGGMTLNDLAKEVLASQGRRGDTQLAHINRREAAILKDMGGSGTINPDTGMAEFYDGADFSYDALGGDPYGNVTGAPVDYSYMAPESVSFESGFPDRFQEGELYGGQPTPQVGGGQTAPTPQINFEDPRSVASAFPDLYPGGVPPAAGQQTRFAPAGPSYEQATPIAQQPAEPGMFDRAERLAKQYPTATRLATVAGLSIPGQMAARRARQDAARTRAEMEQMAAPIRAQGEAQLAAGQRGELTASQQQQVRALEAAQAQDRARRGVTSGTAAEQDRIRTAEFVQRLAQTNIDNGVRLIGAANTFNAQAIRDAYKMNTDAATMTQAYYAQLMRAAGALPAETTTTVTRTA